MARYIDIDREIALMKNTLRGKNESDFAYSIFKLFIDRLEKAPTADVESIQHGEWVPIVNYRNGKPDGRYYCSKCHKVETTKGIYCRLCGAHMDGGINND